jgi:hypothetical protein
VAVRRRVLREARADGAARRRDVRCPDDIYLS